MDWDDIENAEQQTESDYYKILGVSRNATEKEIKSAYRKQAKMHHPDKNVNNEQDAKLKFQEINKAYQVLKDKDKRKIYDKYGEQGLQNRGFKFEINNLDDLFAATFGDDDDKNNYDDDKDIILAEKTVNVTLKELYTGTVKTINFNFKYNCKECDGTGKYVQIDKTPCNQCGGKGKEPILVKDSVNCDVCSGTGRKFVPNQNITCNGCNATGKKKFGKIERLCSKCNGKGSVPLSFKCPYCWGGYNRDSYKLRCNTCNGLGRVQFYICNTCNGNGQVPKHRTVMENCGACYAECYIYTENTFRCRVCNGKGKCAAKSKIDCKIEPGTADGDIIRQKYMNHEKGVYGKVSLKVKCQKEDHPLFVRSESNLMTKMTISLRQALLGGDFVITHIDGSRFKVNCSYDVLQINETKKIKGKGMPIRGGNKGQCGDLFVKFKIKMPSGLSKHDIKQICECLPAETDQSNDVKITNKYSKKKGVKLIELDQFDEMELQGIKQNNKENDEDENVECKQM